MSKQPNKTKVIELGGGTSKPSTRDYSVILLGNTGKPILDFLSEEEMLFALLSLRVTRKSYCREVTRSLFGKKGPVGFLLTEHGKIVRDCQERLMQGWLVNRMNPARSVHLSGLDPSVFASRLNDVDGSPQHKLYCNLVIAHLTKSPARVGEVLAWRVRKLEERLSNGKDLRDIDEALSVFYPMKVFSLVKVEAVIITLMAQVNPIRIAMLNHDLSSWQKASQAMITLTQCLKKLASYFGAVPEKLFIDLIIDLINAISRGLVVKRLFSPLPVRNLEHGIDDKAYNRAVWEAMSLLIPYIKQQEVLGKLCVSLRKGLSSPDLYENAPAVYAELASRITGEDVLDDLVKELGKEPANTVQFQALFSSFSASLPNEILRKQLHFLMDSLRDVAGRSTPDALGAGELDVLDKLSFTIGRLQKNQLLEELMVSLRGMFAASENGLFRQSIVRLLIEHASHPLVWACLGRLAVPLKERLDHPHPVYCEIAWFSLALVLPFVSDKTTLQSLSCKIAHVFADTEASSAIRFLAEKARSAIPARTLENPKYESQVALIKDSHEQLCRSDLISRQTCQEHLLCRLALLSDPTMLGLELLTDIFNTLLDGRVPGYMSQLFRLAPFVQDGKSISKFLARNNLHARATTEAGYLNALISLFPCMDDLNKHQAFIHFFGLSRSFIPKIRRSVFVEAASRISDQGYLIELARRVLKEEAITHQGFMPNVRFVYRTNGRISQDAWGWLLPVLLQGISDRELVIKLTLTFIEGLRSQSKYTRQITAAVALTMIPMIVGWPILERMRFRHVLLGYNTVEAARLRFSMDLTCLRDKSELTDIQAVKFIQRVWRKRRVTEAEGGAGKPAVEAEEVTQPVAEVTPLEEYITNLEAEDRRAYASPISSFAGHFYRQAGDGLRFNPFHKGSKLIAARALREFVDSKEGKTPADLQGEIRTLRRRFAAFQNGELRVFLLAEVAGIRQSAQAPRQAGSVEMARL
jgi:hypothetical protein